VPCERHGWDLVIVGGLVGIRVLFPNILVAVGRSLFLLGVSNKLLVNHFLDLLFVVKLVQLS
jgi:hypothetical protein